MPTDTKTFLIVALVVLAIGLRLYRSVRRNIGRQRLQRVRLMVRVGFFLLVAGMVFTLSPGLDATVLAGAAAGALIGAGIAAYALTHTRIERTDQGVFYTGHPYIGLGILGLFVVRLVFNLATAIPKMQEAAAQAQAHPGVRQAMMSPASSPLTLGVFALMVSYYVFYSLGLLRLAK